MSLVCRQNRLREQKVTFEILYLARSGGRTSPAWRSAPEGPKVMRKSWSPFDVRMSPNSSAKAARAKSQMGQDADLSVRALAVPVSYLQPVAHGETAQRSR